jgi:rare lipoprotein A
MRFTVAAGALALVLSPLSVTTANALDACWPGCSFDKPVAKSESSRYSGSKSRSSRGSRVASYDSDDERPSRRGRSNLGMGAGSGGGSGGGGSTGVASYYWQPQRVASGGWFNPNAMTAAHRTLPFGTRVRVTNVSNGRSVEVTINDRGPFVGGRIIDLSKAAAGAINMQGQGLAQVRMEVVGR